MKNKKGFILTETLVVTVFLVTISTFIYVSVVPLMGRYEDLAFRESDIDIVYKLYNLRKLLYSDSNTSTILDKTIIHSDTYRGVREITCSDFTRSDYCTAMINQMGLTNYKFIYIEDIYDGLYKTVPGKSPRLEEIDLAMNSVELRQYLGKYKNDEGEYVLLLDRVHHTIAHLLYKPFIQID